jgi:hypothetical protein
MKPSLKALVNSEARSATQSQVASGRVFSALAIVGLFAHLVVAVIAGNRLSTPLSGGGDVQHYVTLAANLRNGDGFTYAHVPTAFRPPLYPLLLAALMWLSPGHWIALLHVFQFLVSIATAGVCALLAARWFGRGSGPIALAVALLLPTQIYFTGEVLTECTASLLGILFLLYLDCAVKTSRTRDWILVGAIAGAASLERFNAAGLVLVIAAVALGWPANGLRHRIAKQNLRSLALSCASCAVVLSPWIAHTAIAFHGKALYSTHTGFAAVEGILSPTGRAQEGETTRITQILGWGNWSVETNTPAVPEFRDEVALNHQALSVAQELWRNVDWHLIPIISEKIGAFWLSTDQILHISMVSSRNRSLRRVGVGGYWAVLALAVVGWFRLSTSQPGIARVVLFYAVLLTAIHLPLTMNTRLRSPLFDPLLASLSAGGLLTLAVRSKAEIHKSGPTCLTSVGPHE